MEAVRIQGKGNILTTNAVETQGKGSALATKAVGTRGKRQCLSHEDSGHTRPKALSYRVHAAEAFEKTEKHHLANALFPVVLLHPPLTLAGFSIGEMVRADSQCPILVFWLSPSVGAGFPAAQPSPSTAALRRRKANNPLFVSLLSPLSPPSATPGRNRICFSTIRGDARTFSENTAPRIVLRILFIYPKPELSNGHLMIALDSNCALNAAGARRAGMISYLPRSARVVCGVRSERITTWEKGEPAVVVALGDRCEHLQLRH